MGAQHLQDIKLEFATEAKELQVAPGASIWAGTLDLIMAHLEPHLRSPI